MNEESGLKYKRKRREIFPESISEPLVTLRMREMNKKALWDIPKNDVISGRSVIEVKCFTSTGPNSFSPSSKWDVLYFVDGTNYETGEFKIYRIPLSSESTKFREIYFSNSETFGEMRDQNRRNKLRTKFENIKRQIHKRYGKKYCELVFDGVITDLDPSLPTSFV